MLLQLMEDLLKNKNFLAKVKVSTKSFKANEKILSQASVHRKVYIIRKGKVRIIVQSEDKVKSSNLRPGIADLETNDIFGEFGLFDDQPASADVIALIDSELIEIDIPTFRTFLNETPEIASKIYFSIIQILVKRLRHADKTIFSLYTWGMKAHKLDQHLE